MTEVLIPLHPEGDFEKLLFAERALKDMTIINKSLLREIGVLKSEIDQIKHENHLEELQSVKQANNALRNDIGNLNQKIKDLKSSNLYLRGEISKLVARCQK